MPAVVGLILQGILAAISAAPQVEQIVTSGKSMIDALFTAKLIDSTQQGALHAYVDGHWALVKAGITPPAWTVEPNPA